MIDSVSGRISSKSPTHVVIDVGGVALRLAITLPTFDRLPPAGQKADLLAHLHVREDALELYGFSEAEERALFRLLIGVSGIGPKSAVGILSGARWSEIQGWIVSGNVALLHGLPGVGPKTARRLVVELKDKFVAVAPEEVPPMEEGAFTGPQADAVAALESLGFTRQEAARKLAALRKDGKLPAGSDLQTILREALARK